jgi:hypothetical protein
MKLAPCLLFAIAASYTSPAYTEPAVTIPCVQHLTFRWTSGKPIRIDVPHPPPTSLENPPFLQDPEIISIVSGQNRFGGTIIFTFGPSPAVTLAAESSTHIHQQMLIMLGDTVIIAAMVLERLSDVVVAQMEPNDSERENLTKTLQLNTGSQKKFKYCN